MKVSKRDIYILLIFVGILAVVASYFLVYQPNIESAELIEAENQELQDRIADLSGKMEQKDSYVEETAAMNEEMDTILQQFPIDVREEDAVLLAINQELISPMVIDSIGITATEPTVLPDMEEEDVDHTYEIDEIEEYEAQEGIADEAEQAADAQTGGVANEDMAYVLMQRSVTMNYLVSYEGLKRGIKNISVQDNRMSINNLTVSYDESTGLLTGTTVVDMYCIPGQDKEYVQPNFSSVLLGSDNIFGSLETYGIGQLDIGESAADGEEAGDGGAAQ